MPPRKRLPENEGLEPNVHVKKAKGRIYYEYVDPKTGQRTHLGSNKIVANEVAKAANRELEKLPERKRVKYSIKGIHDEWLPKRQERVGSDNTRKHARVNLALIKKEFGTRDISDLSARELTDFLETIPASYRGKVRNEAILLFKYALARGYLHHTYGNPAEVTEYITPPKAKRMRLGYKDYQRIFELASPALQTMMGVMLQTTLRPNDAVNLRFDQVYDGALHTQIRKSGKYLKMECGSELLSLIKKARTSGIASPYIVHAIPKRRTRNMSEHKTHPTQRTVDQLSREFSKLRDSLGIGSLVEKIERPSLYEIRSLASELYEKSGQDQEEISKLMAHTSVEMTRYYLDDRRVNYVTVYAGLSL